MARPRIAPVRESGPDPRSGSFTWSLAGCSSRGGAMRWRAAGVEHEVLARPRCEGGEHRRAVPERARGRDGEHADDVPAVAAADDRGLANLIPTAARRSPTSF